MTILNSKVHKELVAYLKKVLNLPDRVVSFEVRFHPNELVSVKCEYHPELKSEEETKTIIKYQFLE